MLDGVELNSHGRMHTKSTMNNNESKIQKAPKVGDIVYNSWGFDQTNIDWYRVEKVSPKFVTIVEIKGKLKDGEEGFMCGHSIPVQPVEVISETMRKSWRSENETYYVNFKYGGGGLWDGLPRYTSWYA